MYVYPLILALLWTAISLAFFHLREGSKHSGSLAIPLILTILFATFLWYETWCFYYLLR